MSASDSLTPQRVSELVLANRAIRAPYYVSDHDEGVRFTNLDRGLQWGVDAIPSLMGLFRVEQETRDDHPNGWVGLPATGEEGRYGWTSTGPIAI